MTSGPDPGAGPSSTPVAGRAGRAVGGSGTGAVLVVGTGLIGTSIGLALRLAGYDVYLADQDVASLQLAVALGAGRGARPESDPAVVLVAVPPAVAAVVIHDLQQIYLQSIFSDTSSVKSHVVAEVASSGADLGRFVGGHPLAGRERSGPGAARADLFEGRPWVLTPTSGTPADAVDVIRTVVEACGAVPVIAGAELHDQAVALVSHVPQLVASLTAARLVDASPEALSLAGQGLRDMTRIADSDPVLWGEIVAANAGPVLAVLDSFAEDLDGIRAELRLAVGKSSGTDQSRDPLVTKATGRDVDTVTAGMATHSLIERGNLGRTRLPGKHGAARVEFSVVPVVVADRPGELARLLVASGAAGVNVEDVAIEHSSGQPAGLVELSVRPEVAQRLADALREGGWSVHA